MDAAGKSVLKWGGIAGILGSLLLLGVFAFLAAFVGLEIREGQAAIERFPDIRWARIIENTAYLFSLVLWTVHSVALYLALRAKSPGMVLAAGVISVLGLTILAVGAIPHTAETAIAALYHAPETPPEFQPVLVAAWEVSLAWVDTFVVAGLVLTPVGLLLFGAAMLGDASFGKVSGWISILLGLAGGYAAVAGLTVGGDIVAIGIFALVFFHIIQGWKSFRLSR